MDKEESWEVSKENVQPLRTGRNVDCLKAALQPSVLDIEHLLQERRSFEEEILADENSKDPIDAWSRYLKWTQQHLTLGENRKTYESFLKKYIKKFLKYDQYKNDPRYVNAWLLLSQITENSESTFAYMRGENIGTLCASYYVAWAEDYEKYGKYKKAAAVYKLGEEQEAQPAEILYKMKRAFENRLARRAVAEVEKGRESSAELQRSPRRKVLANLKMGRTMTNSDSVGKPFDQTNKQTNARVSIYNEGDQNKGIMGDNSKWGSVPSNSNLNKENVQQAEMWQGCRLKQQMRIKHIPHQSQPAGFKIFEDAGENFSDKSASSSCKTLHKIEQLLTEQKSSPSEESTSHRAIREMYGDSNDNVVQKYPVDKVYSVMGEFQLEEIYAAYWKKRNKKQWELATKKGNHPQENMPCNKENEISAKEQTIYTNKEPDYSDDDSTPQHPLANSSTHLLRASPTIVTKQVTGEILEMFNKSFGDDEVFTDANTPGLLKENKRIKIFCEEKSADASTPGAGLPCESDKTVGVAITGSSKNLCNDRDEMNPTFLNDVTIARGQCGDYSGDSIYFNKQDDLDGFNLLGDVQSETPGCSSLSGSMMKFGAGSALAESTSYKIASISNGEFPCKSTVDFREKSEASQPKKLSPILEASDEGGKPEVTKSSQSVEVYNEKSFLNPTSVHRAHPARGSVLKFDADQFVLGSSTYESSRSNFGKLDCEDSSHGLLKSTGDQTGLNQIKLDAVEDLCAEFMSASVSERFEQEDDVKFQLFPDDVRQSSVKSTDPAVEARPKINVSPSEGNLSPNEMNNEEAEEIAVRTEQIEQNASMREVEMNVVHDPWDEIFVQKIVEDSSHLKQMKNMNEGMPRLRSGSSFHIGEETFSLIEVIGQGGFAKVYKAIDSHQKAMAMKVQSPACTWEMHIIEEVKQRLKANGLDNFCPFMSELVLGVVYRDASLIFSSYIQHGTLLDYLAYINISGKQVPQNDIALQVLQLVDALHSIDVIHGDIKPDNFMVTSDYKNSSGSSPKLKLIDFGRAIDLRAYPQPTAFSGNCKTSGFVCSQMKLNQPWNYHVDLYGVAGTIHVVLVKKYMTTIQDKDGTWRTANKLPRYFSAWNDLFHQLLNFPTPSEELIPTYRDSPLPSMIRHFEDLQL